MKLFIQDGAIKHELEEDSAQVIAYNQKKIQRRLEITIKNNRRKKAFYKLVLKNCKMASIPFASCKMLEKSRFLSSLKQLNLSEMGLRSLKNLPSFKCLLKLELTMNFIRDKQIQYLIRFKTLQIVYLTENNISKKETIKQLSALPELKEIDISANPVESEYERIQVFAMLPRLQIYNRYNTKGKDLQRNKMFDSGSDSESESASSEQNSEFQANNRMQNLHEESDIIDDSDSEDLGQAPKTEMVSQTRVRQKKQKSITSMTKQELKQVYEQSKLKLKKMLEQIG